MPVLTNAEKASYDVAVTQAASALQTAGAGMTSTGTTANVIANADASIVVNANDIQVAAAIQSGAAAGATAAQTAGAGMTATGTTFNVIANADASIVVNANDIQVAAAIQSGAAAGATALQPSTAVTVSALTVTQAVATSGSPNAVVVTGAAHTTLTASTEATDVSINLARTVQFSTGALTTQRACYVQAPTYAFVGASTLTTAATVAISGPPIAGTNATITNTYALLVESGNIRVASTGELRARNNAGTADITLITKNSSDRVLVAGATTTCTIQGSVVVASSGQNVGYFGGAGTAKQTVTGSRGGNAALASILTILAGHGLVTDSSTA